jgi:hypothetical protein
MVISHLKRKDSQVIMSENRDVMFKQAKRSEWKCQLIGMALLVTIGVCWPAIELSAQVSQSPYANSNQPVNPAFNNSPVYNPQVNTPQVNTPQVNNPQASASQPNTAQPTTGQPNSAQGSTPPAEHPLSGALKLVRMSKEALKSVADYEAILTKREMINGQLTVNQMQLRLRHKPFSVYVNYRQPYAGREVLFVEGQNGNNLLAHEGSGIGTIAGTQTLPINGAMAMKDNHHPINMIGMSNLLDQVIKQWEVEAQYGEINVQYYPEAKIGQMNCVAIEVTHPQPRRQFPYSMARVYLDRGSHFPVRVELYGWPQQQGVPPPLWAEYTYSKIQTNIGMVDFDFDRRNPRYKF